jgi:hypothetical protein
MTRIRILVSLFVLAGLFAGVSAEATIQRLDFCSAQFAPNEAVPMIRNFSRTIIVRGDLVDTITRVDPPAGVTVSIGQRTGGGGLQTSVALTLTVSATATTGNRDVKLRYLVEVSGPDVFQINVRPLSVNTIAINPAGNQVQRGSEVTITASGQGLSNLRLKPQFQNLFTNFANVTTGNNTTFSFRGNAQQNLSLSSVGFIDSSITAEGVQESCASGTGNGTLSYTVGDPDLVISKATPTYRLQAPEACNGQIVAVTQDKFCTDLAGALPNPTPQNPHIEQARSVGGIVYIVTNPTAFPVTGTFRVQLKNGINVLAEDTITGLAAGGRRVLTFSRPENRRMLMRDLNCSKCYDLQVAPFNWTEPVYTTIVDVGGQITEGNENNNSQTSN